MAQLFRPEADTYIRIGIALIALAALGAFSLPYIHARSDRAWNVGRPAEQPIPFRHDLHAGGLGIDCRYCHSSVERSAAAGMPSAQTCMTCHSLVWAGASVLEPLRTSLALGVPLAWARLHDLPEHAFFRHGIHVAKGVACETCHGDVGSMAETVKAETLSMGWCLSCHRDPQPYLDLAGAVPDIATARLTSCSTCHR
jgi:hypothetical protein